MNNKRINRGELFVLMSFLIIFVSIMSSIVVVIEIIDEQYQKALEIQNKNRKKEVI